MLTDIELENLFDELGTPEAGRNLVRKARREAPVRQVRSNGSNLITRYPSKKMNRVIETESRTAEFPAMLHYERDPKVLEYYAQPLEVDQKVPLANGKATRLLHTPDFLLITQDGIVIEEWRQEARLLKHSMLHPTKFLRDASGWRFPLAESYFADRGLNYRLRSAGELPRQYIQNLTFLESYLDASHPGLERQEFNTLKQVFLDKSSIHLRTLLEVPGLTPDAIYKAIADKVVAFDLYNDNLGETDRVSVYRDAPTMAFLQASQAPTVGFPQERLDTAIQPGGKIIMGKREYEILFADGDYISATYQGKVTEFLLDTVEKLHQSGGLKILPDPSGPRVTKFDSSRVDSFTPAELDTALERMRLIEAAALDPNSVFRSARTLRRYRRSTRLAEDNAFERHLALVPRHALKGRRDRRLSQEVLSLIPKVVRKHFNDPKNISVKTAYWYFRTACEGADLEPCSLKTFSKKLKANSSTRARMGKRMAYQEGQFVNYLHIKEEVHGVRPFQIVHIDHTQIQLEFCLPNSKESLGRAWLTLAIDAESRAIVGSYLTFDPPSYRSCMMVLRDIVRRHGRLPEMLLLDNGKEFHSKAMMRLCGLYGVSIRYRPAGEPRFGAVMERVFGTVQSQLINQLAGNTQLLRYVRSVTRQVMPENFVTWTLPAFHAAMDYYFKELYGKNPHPVHGDGPVEHLDRRLRETGERRNRLVVYDFRFLVETCPSPVDRDTRVVDRQRGVKINHGWYHCNESLTPSLDGTPVEVRVDPWDIRFVYALVENRWVRCANNQLAIYRNYTEVELLFALEEAKKRTRDKSAIHARAAEWVKVLNPENWTDDQRKEDDRQRECRRIYEPLRMGDIESATNNSTESAPVTEKHATPRSALKKQARSEAAQTTLNTHKSSHWDKEDDYELF